MENLHISKHQKLSNEAGEKQLLYPQALINTLASSEARKDVLKRVDVALNQSPGFFSLVQEYYGRCRGKRSVLKPIPTLVMLVRSSAVTLV